MATVKEVRDTWNKKAAQLVGRKIVGARYLNKAEASKMGWDRSPMVLVLDDGTALIPSCDDEGNDAGVLFHAQPSGDFDGFPVLPV